MTTSHSNMFIDKRGFIVSKENRDIDKVATASRLKLVSIDYMSYETFLTIKPGTVWFFDVECYPNFFLVMFKCSLNDQYVAFELSPWRIANYHLLGFMIRSFCVVGFNSKNYDVPMVMIALNGYDTYELKRASNDIVENSYWITDIENEYGIDCSKINNVDIMEVLRGKGSLKMYSGRLHCDSIQDLPFPHNEDINEEQAAIVRVYCGIDLDNTQLNFNELAKQIQLRIDMSRRYQIDLRSKSDAQIAEAVLVSEIRKKKQEQIHKPKDIPAYVTFNVPEYISFITPYMQEFLELVRNAFFYLSDGGNPIIPPELEDKHLKIGHSTYKFGIGGLHSTESEVAHFANETTIIEDIDVASYYPNIILNQCLYPPQFGRDFLEVYQNIVDTRIKAKDGAKAAEKSGDSKLQKDLEVVANSLKITINGSFGKLGNKYSYIYAPQLMLQVTLSGQLSLLMLIEMLELNGIPVVSGNTDGIVLKYHVSREADVRAIVNAWEAHTKFKMEFTRYEAIFNRDVNSYIAMKPGTGKEGAESTDKRLNFKTKGFFSAAFRDPEITPSGVICVDALLYYLRHRVPLEKTIKECTDIRRFLCLRNVKGGAIYFSSRDKLHGPKKKYTHSEKLELISRAGICETYGGYYRHAEAPEHGEYPFDEAFKYALQRLRMNESPSGYIYLGKVVRWYYSVNSDEAIYYMISGNKVADTDGAVPLMDLPKEIPSDLDYNWYIEKANEMLYLCGYKKRPVTRGLFFNN